VRYFTPDISVTGFPEFYTPGGQYEILVKNLSGLKIHQFNASVRVGDSEFNAGMIEAGDATAIYDTTGESNGVHWAWPNTDSGTFVWTAPPEGTGEVRLYWAGLQGYRTYGADTSLVLASVEQTTGIDNLEISLPRYYTLSAYPNPFNNSTIIELDNSPDGEVDIVISDILGRSVYESKDITVSDDKIRFVWSGSSKAGIKLPSGIYFICAETSDGLVISKVTLLR